jgi:hypothetical protein
MLFVLDVVQDGNGVLVRRPFRVKEASALAVTVILATHACRRPLTFRFFRRGAAFLHRMTRIRNDHHGSRSFLEIAVVVVPFVGSVGREAEAVFVGPIDEILVALQAGGDIYVDPAIEG